MKDEYTLKEYINNPPNIKDVSKFQNREHAKIIISLFITFCLTTGIFSKFSESYFLLGFIFFTLFHFFTLYILGLVPQLKGLKVNGVDIINHNYPNSSELPLELIGVSINDVVTLQKNINIQKRPFTKLDITVMHHIVDEFELNRAKSKH